MRGCRYSGGSALTKHFLDRFFAASACARARCDAIRKCAHRLCCAARGLGGGGARRSARARLVAPDGTKVRVAARCKKKPNPCPNQKVLMATHRTHERMHIARTFQLLYMRARPVSSYPPRILIMDSAAACAQVLAIDAALLR